MGMSEWRFYGTPKEQWGLFCLIPLGTCSKIACQISALTRDRRRTSDDWIRGVGFRDISTAPQSPAPANLTHFLQTKPWQPTGAFVSHGTLLDLCACVILVQGQMTVLWGLSAPCLPSQATAAPDSKASRLRLLSWVRGCGLLRQVFRFRYLG